MLKRIAYFGKSEPQQKRLEALAKDANAQVMYIGAKEEIPPAVTALSSDGESIAHAFKAAVEMGERSEALLGLVADAVDCREGFPEGASLRVMEHASRFAAALKLSANDQLALERGALVRDIGKMRIPNQILLKEGVLTYEEWRLLQQHTNLGAGIAAKSRSLSDTFDIIKSHHECYDGDGYPEGLEGDAIPYLARIVKLLDVYCAMTSPRHYRKGHCSHEEAAAYLRSERGKHFDPKLVDVFINAKVGRTPSPKPSTKARTVRKGKKA